MAHAHTLQLYGAAGVRYNVEAMTRSDVELMLDVKAGDEASFNLLLQKYRTPLVNFLLPRGPKYCDGGRPGAGSFFARVSRAEAVFSQREIHNLDVSHRDEPGAEFDCAIIAIARWTFPLTRRWKKTSTPLQLPARELRIDEKMIERDRSEFIRRAIHGAAGKTARRGVVA